jgi:hypothetical protein
VAGKTLAEAIPDKGLRLNITLKYAMENMSPEQAEACTQGKLGPIGRVWSRRRSDLHPDDALEK